MQRSTLSSSLFLVSLLTAACASDGTSAPAAATDQEPLDMMAVMAKMAEYATPGAPHAELASSAGHWTVEGSYYMEPGGEPTPMTATADREVLMGGRMTRETFRSDFQGMPFEGMLLEGYDNLKGEYWSQWFDNMSTWGSYSHGNYDAAGDLVLDGMMYDAMTPAGRAVRTVVHHTDADHVTMRMYDVQPDGSTNLTMELNYTRAE